jgi:hypothetical protein
MANRSSTNTRPSTKREDSPGKKARRGGNYAGTSDKSSMPIVLAEMSEAKVRAGAEAHKHKSGWHI